MMGAIADHLRRQLEQDIRTKGLLINSAYLRGVIPS
jgi:hypothetical protein